MTEPRHRADTPALVEAVRAVRAQAAVKADATKRSTRTLVQGLAVDVLFAVATGLLLWLPDADLSSREAWLVLGTSLAKTVLTAAASYAMRLKVKPS